MDVGTQIEQYKIISHVGRGGMADVWAAKDLILARTVAIKTIARDLSANASDPISLFKQEARTIANLEHPHILPIYGFGEYQSRLYIVMRYVTGGSLEDRLRNSSMSFEDALRLTRAIASALEHAHTSEEAVIHLDLKPPNILLDSKGVPYLADFGLATVLDREGRARNPGSGTLLYMAPEQMVAEQLDRRVDVYSFSLVIYHMLTGHLPFSGGMPLALKQMQFGEMLPRLRDANSTVPDSITDILRRGTAQRPDDRYPTIAALVTDFESAMLHVMGGSMGENAGGSGLSSAFVDVASLLDPAQAERQEAEALYERARLAWANGSGRFLLGFTHFTVMSDFYLSAEQYGLTYDSDGLQMLLRGAIEHNYALENWWERLTPNTRRLPCLHAIRSENPAARVRALERLTTLPDAIPPQIPRQVAQGLQLETEPVVQLAALAVLDSQPPSSSQTADAHGWLSQRYTEGIDLIVAEMAINPTLTPEVSAQAARTVGTMRSGTGVRYFVEEFQRGVRGTSRALANVLDTAPTFPVGTPLSASIGGWIRNTGRAYTRNPLEFAWAAVFALLFAWVGMGQHVYRTFRSEQIFTQVRITNTLAIGSMFGLVALLLTLLGHTLPMRLRGDQRNRARLVIRLIWSTSAAFGLSLLLWWMYVWMFLNLDSPPLDILLLTTIATTIGVVLPVWFKLPSWVGFLVTVALTFGAHLIGFYNFWRPVWLGLPPLLGMSEESFIFVYDYEHQVWSVMLPMLALLALGIHFMPLMADVRAFISARMTNRETPAPRRTSEIPAVPLGMLNTQHIPSPFDDATKELNLSQLAGQRSTQPLQSLTPQETQPLVDMHFDPKTGQFISQTKPAEPTTQEFEANQVAGRSVAAPQDEMLFDSKTGQLKRVSKTMPQVSPPSIEENDDWDSITRDLDRLDSTPPQT